MVLLKLGVERIGGWDSIGIDNCLYCSQEITNFENW